MVDINNPISIDDKGKMKGLIERLFELANKENLEVRLLHTQTRTERGLENTGHEYQAWRKTTFKEASGLMEDDGGLFMGGTYFGGGMDGKKMEGFWVKTNNEAFKVCAETTN